MEVEAKVTGTYITVKFIGHEKSLNEAIRQWAQRRKITVISITKTGR